MAALAEAFGVPGMVLWRSDETIHSHGLRRQMRRNRSVRLAAHSLDVAGLEVMLGEARDARRIRRAKAAASSARVNTGWAERSSHDMFSSDDTVRLPANERVVELGGERPIWLWVRTCAQPQCDCRSAFVVATDAGREALHEQGAAVRNALAAGATQREVGVKLIDIDHFLLDIDTARVSWFNGRDEIDVRDHPRLGPIARRIDGELLDVIGCLWHLGKGRPDPEQRVLNARKVVPRGWKRGDLLAWDELCAGVRRDLYDVGHHVYEAHELYCPVPECTCGKVVIDFEARSPRGATHPGGIVVSSSDTAAKLEPSKRGQARLERLWAAFQQRHPRYTARFARRYATIRIIGARFVGPEDADTSPKAKVGRNDPCPCGSGRKYKKCCGVSSA